jgi:hypothetical protein
MPSIDVKAIHFQMFREQGQLKGGCISYHIIDECHNGASRLPGRLQGYLRRLHAIYEADALEGKFVDIDALYPSDRAGFYCCFLH